MAEPNAQQSTGTVTHLGSYRLVEPLGSGGMSSVFRAVHEGTGYVVAVKVLPRYLARKSTLLRRFLREAENAEALEHPNIVSIYDRGSEDGRYYLVLEFVAGSDLHDRVRRLGPMDVPLAVDCMLQAIEGLKYAASKGVIHRDIKPANLLIDVDGTVKLIDLGLALQNDAEDERVTRDGTTVGTVDYMAPEQARDSRAATLRSDIYSLGCTFYYLLTGFPPFPGGDIAEKLRRHAQQAPPDVRGLRPDVPRPVAKLIRRMMAKKPDDRFASYDELLAALRALELEPGSGDREAGSSFEYALIAEDDDADFELGSRASGPGVNSTMDTPTVSDASALREAAAREAEPAPPAEPESEIRLADLLDDEDDAPPARPNRPPSETPPAPLPRNRGRPKPPERDAPIEAEIVEDDEDFDPFGDLRGEVEDEAIPIGAIPARRRGYGEEASARSWAIGGALVGLVIALLGFALISLLRMDWSSPSAGGDGAVATEPADALGQNGRADFPAVA